MLKGAAEALLAARDVQGKPAPGRNKPASSSHSPAPTEDHQISAPYSNIAAQASIKPHQGCIFKNPGSLRKIPTWKKLL